MPNPNEGQFMMAGRVECVASTLMDVKGNVRPRVATEVKQHPNDGSIVGGTLCGWTVVILRKWGDFDQGANWCGEAAAKAHSFDDAFGKDSLEEGDLVTSCIRGTKDVDTKETFC